jgi:hypothetical protein
MKKILTAVLLICGTLVYGQTAVLQNMSGAVEIKAPGSSEWKPAVQGQRLEKTAVISTGFRSTALIALGNSTITVRALTRLSLEEIIESQGAEEVRLYLQAGRVRADVRPPAAGRTNFQIRTPSVTASVRGTSFEFDGTTLTVDEGRVHVTGGDHTGVYVGEGHMVRADSETGRIIAPAETFRESLTLPLAVGLDQAPESAAPSAASAPEILLVPGWK